MKGTQATTRILVVDDEANIRTLLETVLADEGYDVRSAPDGQAGLSVARDWNPDAIVLDVMLPKIDGIALLPMFRRLTEAPIIMLSALNEMQTKVDGFEGGADDYISKPFESPEFVARVGAALRRPRLKHTASYRFADLLVDLAARTAFRDDVRFDLTAREFDLLVAFVRNPNIVFSRDQLLDVVWGTGRDVTPNAVETYVSYLRAKIDRPGGRATIRTHRGVGYSLGER
jgi:DNA-binding response OmpR family regulator